MNAYNRTYCGIEFQQNRTASRLRRRIAPVGRLLAIALLLIAAGLGNPKPTSAQPNQVEVFDVKAGKVVRQFPMAPDIRSNAERWIGSISGIVASVNPEPKEGIIIGIPLTPSLQVSNNWVRDRAKVLFVFINRMNIRQPTLLLINEEDQPLLYQATVDMSPFLEQYRLTELLRTRSSEIVRQISAPAGEELFQQLHRFYFRS